MCRLFGFRSIIQSTLHTSLLSGENALITQSTKHPDGWGVSYYVNNAPHVIKSQSSAFEDNLFKKLANLVTAQTVIAHIRKKTIGNHSILNTHPFQYGQWIFAHNGNIKNFENLKDPLLKLIPLDLQQYIFGSTDSEIIFFIILGELAKSNKINDANSEDLSTACKKAIQKILNIIGPLHPDNNGCPEENYLTFLITDGNLLFAHHGGKDLYYSTYKRICSEKDTCPYFAPECISAPKHGTVRHLILSSEPLSGENIWHKMHISETICIDGDMNFQKKKINLAK